MKRDDAIGEARDLKLRERLLRLRVLSVPDGHVADPNSPEYLYLVQQRKRLALSATIGRLRPRYLLLFPQIGFNILARSIDLWITNQIVRSMINEWDLLEQSRRSPERVD